MYVVEDFGKEEYLDGVMCSYAVKHLKQDREVAYVFNKTVAEWIAKGLTEGEEKSKEYGLEYNSYISPVKI